MKTLLRATTSFIFAIAVSMAFGQKADPKSLELAIERTEVASKILKDITALPDDEGIPKNVTDKAVLIGVVPDATRLSLLVSRATSGHGILSERSSDKGWGLPLFISYYSAPGFKFSSAGGKKLDILFVVTLERSPGSTKDSKDNSTRSKRETARIETYTYAFADGDLKLINTESLSSDSFFGFSGFFKDSSHWKNDESLNRAVYGVKGREVDAGKVTESKIATPLVIGFRDTLNQLFAVKIGAP